MVLYNKNIDIIMDDSAEHNDSAAIYFGTDGESVPPEFVGLFEHIPEDEDVIYWMRADNSSFWKYYKYINSETCWSCPPFSFIFPCCNVVNMPCIYSDYRNNSNKILMLTKESVVFGSVEQPYSCCCFTPDAEDAAEHAEIFTWRSIKYIGSKQEFNGMNKENSSPMSCVTHACFNEPQDILLVAKTKREQNPRGMWLDHVPYRAMRLDELRQLKSEIIAAGPVRNSKGIKLVELGNIKRTGSDEDSAVEENEHKPINGSSKPEENEGAAVGGGGYSPVGEGEQETKRSDSAEADELGDVYTGGEEFVKQEAEMEAADTAHAEDGAGVQGIEDIYRIATYDGEGDEDEVLDGDDDRAASYSD
jgi:hypothetical protein